MPFAEQTEKLGGIPYIPGKNKKNKKPNNPECALQENSPEDQAEDPEGKSIRKIREHVDKPYRKIRILDKLVKPYRKIRKEDKLHGTTPTEEQKPHRGGNVMELTSVNHRHRRSN